MAGKSKTSKSHGVAKSRHSPGDHEESDLSFSHSAGPNLANVRVGSALDLTHESSHAASPLAGARAQSHRADGNGTAPSTSAHPLAPTPPPHRLDHAASTPYYSPFVQPEDGLTFPALATPARPTLARAATQGGRSDLTARVRKAPLASVAMPASPNLDTPPRRTDEGEEPPSPPGPSLAALGKSPRLGTAYRGLETTPARLALAPPALRDGPLGNRGGVASDSAASLSPLLHPRAYLTEDLAPSYTPPPKPVWAPRALDVTEREKVYTTLLVIPWQLERVLSLGALMALESVLHVFTLLPGRLLRVIHRVLCSLILPSSASLVGSLLRRRRERRDAGAAKKEEGGADQPLVHAPDTAAQGTSTSASLPGASAARSRKQQPRRSNSQNEGPGGTKTALRGSNEGSDREPSASAPVPRGAVPPPSPRSSGTNVPAAPPSVPDSLRPVEQASEDLNGALWLLILAATARVLWGINTGQVYHWIRSQEVIKLYVLYNALEMGDKILAAFGCDCLEALATTCVHVVRSWRGLKAHVIGLPPPPASCPPSPNLGPSGSAPAPPPARPYRDMARALWMLACDVLLAGVSVLAHAVCLLWEAITFSVAINSTDNSLLGLLISNNFVELKGSIFKKMDPYRLFRETLQDVRERVHVYLALAFVINEQAIHVGFAGGILANRALRQCGLVLLSEFLVDMVKHAFTSKQNELRPGLYAEFLRDLCQMKVESRGHNVHRPLALNPLGPAAIIVRMALSFARSMYPALPRGGLTPAQGLGLASLALAAYLALLALKLGLGLALQTFALEYYSNYNSKTQMIGLVGGAERERVQQQQQQKLRGGMPTSSGTGSGGPIAAAMVPEGGVASSNAAPADLSSANGHGGSAPSLPQTPPKRAHQSSNNLATAGVRARGSGVGAA